jgi:hypothetical protein
MSFPRTAVQHCLCALAIVGCFSCGDCVETPSIASLAPTNATAGSTELVLVVNGNDFQRNSTIQWNGAARTTTFVSGHQVTATIPAADLAMPAVATVTVLSPPPSRPVTFGTTAPTTSSATTAVKMNCVGGTSNALNFAINP